MVGSRRTILSKTDYLLLVVLLLMSNSDEHQRRSPDCMFFVYSATAKSKAGRSKKGRDSKASRMSTQSNYTTNSEGVSVADADAYGDDTMPVVEPAKTAKSGKGAKKGAKAKRPVPKSKRQASRVVDENTQVASSFVEPEDDDFEVKVENTLTQSKENKKRKSDVMSSANDVSEHAEVPSQQEESQDRPKKRLATRTSRSVAQKCNASNPPQGEYDHNTQRSDAEDIPPPAPPQGRKKGKGGNTRGSSNVRKVSTASTASKAPLRATTAPDEEIDAALEAELDRPLTDEEGDIQPPATMKPKGRRLTRTKPGPRKATASVAPTRRTTRASTVAVDDSTMQDIYPSLPEPTEEIQVLIPKKNEHAALVHDAPEELSQLEPQEKEKVSEHLEQQEGYSKEAEEPENLEVIAADDDKMDENTPMIEPQQLRSRQASRKLSARNTRVSDIARPFEAMDIAPDINSSVLGTQTAQDDSGHETDASVVKQAHAKRGSKKAPAKKVKGGKKAALMNRNIKEVVQPTVDDASPEEQGTQTESVHDHTGSLEIVSVEVKEPMKQRKPSKAVAKSGKTKKTVPEPEVPTREESVAPSVDQLSTLAESEIPGPSMQPLSGHSTPRPAPSRQSSDAENQPPSSCLSRPGPPSSVQSPFKLQSSRVPLAVTTPISSPSRNNISKLQTTFPWTAVDLEHVFEGTPTADKENHPFILGEVGERVKNLLTSPEKKLTVEQWIQSNAQTGEEKLRNECERLVGKFEDQGVRALRVLEGIVCAERL